MISIEELDNLKRYINGEEIDNIPLFTNIRNKHLDKEPGPEFKGIRVIKTSQEEVEEKIDQEEKTEKEELVDELTLRRELPYISVSDIWSTDLTDAWYIDKLRDENRRLQEEEEEEQERRWREMDGEEEEESYF